jgi:hypothetical protein
MTPEQRTSPKVGLYANTPQNDPGLIVDPVVCVASASGTMRSATAAAEPVVEELYSGLMALEQIGGFGEFAERFAL